MNICAFVGILIKECNNSWRPNRKIFPIDGIKDVVESWAEYVFKKDDSRKNKKVPNTVR